jgi:hypothetical protein
MTTTRSTLSATFSSLIAVFALASAAGCDPQGGDTSDDCTAASKINVYDDLDGDGAGDPLTEAQACALGDGQVTSGDDCNDDDPDISPFATELCDGIDQDCDGEADDGLSGGVWYADTDGDGFGDPATPIAACAQPPDSAVDSSDCDDTDANVNPGALEVCDTIDNDCDLAIDDDDATLDLATTPWHYQDRDLDGYGDPTLGIQACEDPNPGLTVDNGDDCRDNQILVNPGATEICNGLDDDCDLAIDDADPSIDVASQVMWYFDGDHDGFGDELTGVLACVGPLGYVSGVLDCDDNDPNSGPKEDWYVDGDQDGAGAGVPLAGSPSCTQIGVGSAPGSAGIDCDDADPSISPSAAEICGDGIDQDCDGVDSGCGPIGKFLIGDGPAWATNPPTYSCIEACALLFGGVSTDYHCSTKPMVEDFQAFVSGWGDSTYCTTPVAEDFKKSANYDCGAVGCSYSAYVADHCTFGETNYCWK